LNHVADESVFLTSDRAGKDKPMETQKNSIEFGQLSFEPNDVQEDAMKAFLSAADALWRSGELTQAELRFRQALRQAELAFGQHSDNAKRVLSIMTVFYRAQEREEEARELERQLLIPSPVAQQQQPQQEVEEAPRHRNLQSRFLRRKEVGIDQISQLNRVFLPPEIRKACQVLGLPTDGEVSLDAVHKAWKKQIVEKSLHPDLGGEEESSVIVNTSKDTIVRWLESRLPRFGKHVESSQQR
jgi:hypothetical protein